MTLEPYLFAGALVVAVLLGALLHQRRVLRRVARQAEALRRSEERLSLVLEGTEDGFWDWDLRTNRVDRSERWAAMLGYSVAEIPPTLVAGRELIHPDDRHVLDLFDARLGAGGSNRTGIEYRMRTKTGEWRWVLNRGKVVARAADGTPLRMAGTHTDVTDLRQAREEAARQAARFRFIYEQAPIGLSWMQRQHEESRLVNPAYVRITGVSVANSLHTASYVAATHPDDRAHHRELHDQLDHGEIDHFSLEKRHLHPEGRIVWAIFTTHLFRDPVSGVVSEVNTLVDITDRKRAEAERETLGLKMLDAQKLESLGVLAGGIAHDFNNLLTVILANASFARGERGASEERLGPIETAARRAADLCRQMLTYAGKGSFVLEPVALDTLVRDTTHLLNHEIGKNTRLELVLAPDLPPVEADVSQLRQAVIGLVINAAEALGDSPGAIRVAIRLARPAAADTMVRSFDLPAGDCVCLEIADTGPGMSAPTLSRIFDPFFTTKFTGRGLGLAAVLGIVRAHHGALAVESAVGQGTTFRLYLPVSRPIVISAQSRPCPAPVPGDDTPGTLLIADDEPSVLKTIDVMLRRQGHRTVLATNGEEAVQRFTETPDAFAAVLLDLTMPGRDGAEALAAILAQRPFTRALVMSGYSEADITERLRGLGTVAILRKPFTRESLLASLAEVLTGRPPA